MTWTRRGETCLPECRIDEELVTVQMFAGAFESRRLRRPVGFLLANRENPLATLAESPRVPRFPGRCGCQPLKPEAQARIQGPFSSLALRASMHMIRFRSGLPGNLARHIAAGRFPLREKLI